MSDNWRSLSSRYSKKQFKKSQDIFCLKDVLFEKTKKYKLVLPYGLLWDA